MKLVIVSPKMNSIGNFCWLGKSQLTLLLVLINFISAAFHAYKVVYTIIQTARNSCGEISTKCFSTGV